MQYPIRLVCGVVAVALLGCTSATPAPSAKLEGTSWVLVSDVPEGAKAPSLTLQSDGHKVAGSTGCNRFFGQYTLEGQALQFGAMGSTKMACVEPSAMDLEKRFLETLTRTRTYGISGDILELRDGDAVLARFRAATP